MGFDPSKWDFSLRNSCSSPFESFHDVTVAPYRCTVTDSPVGRVASTMFSRKETVGWGSVGLTPMAEGFLERSIAVGSQGLREEGG